MRNDDNPQDSEFSVYLILGSIIVFLIILVPISLIYTIDFNIIILLMIFGGFFLIYFLIMIWGVFKRSNSKNKNNLSDEDLINVKFRSNLSSDVEYKYSSHSDVNFTKLMDNSNDKDDEVLYSLNVCQEDLFRYRK